MKAGCLGNIALCYLCDVFSQTLLAAGQRLDCYSFGLLRAQLSSPTAKRESTLASILAH